MVPTVTARGPMPAAAPVIEVSARSAPATTRRVAPRRRVRIDVPAPAADRPTDRVRGTRTAAGRRGGRTDGRADTGVAATTGPTIAAAAATGGTAPAEGTPAVAVIGARTTADPTAAGGLYHLRK